MNSALMHPRTIALLLLLLLVVGVAVVVAQASEVLARHLFGLVALAVAMTLAIELLLQRRRWRRDMETTAPQQDDHDTSGTSLETALARPSRWRQDGLPWADSVAAFQRECDHLLLEAEAARVQSESCESGVHTVGQASNALAGTCDLLRRRAGLAHSHALMTRCATEDAADALRRATEQVGQLREHLQGVSPASNAVALSLSLDAAQSLAGAEQAIATALDRTDEASSAAADLGGTAARGERVALDLGVACRNLAPVLQEGARGGVCLGVLAATLGQGAGRLGRMLEAAASGSTLPAALRTSLGRDVSAPPSRARRVTQAQGNVLWVRFDGTARNGPGAERA